MIRLLMICFLILIACGSKERKDIDIDNRYETLEIKYNRYVELLNNAERFDSGWITKDCDGLLYNSIASISGVENIDIEMAKDHNNKWYRTPRQNCYLTGQSGSSISRDMFLGLFWWIYQNQRLDLIKEIIDYGRDHKNVLGFWVMGDGDITRTGIRTNLQATAHELRYRLGGADHDARKLPQFWTKETKGYATHLQFLHIFLRGMLREKISEKAFEVMKHHVKYQPNNALFDIMYNMYVNNNFDNALSVLLDNKLFPENSLPTNKNYCTDYLWSRDFDNEDWKPCNRNHDYVRGIDFIFASSLILQKIRRENYGIQRIERDD